MSIPSKKKLTPIVRDLLNDPGCTITDIRSEAVSGGTVGKVHRITGTAKTGAGSSAGWALIRKEQREAPRFGDPGSWRREMQAYRSGLFETLPAGMRVPRCLGIDEPGPRTYVLWMEQADGAHDRRFALEHYAAAARALAHFQGQYLAGRAMPPYPWLSTRYWMANTAADWGTGAAPAFQGFPNQRGRTISFPGDIVGDGMRLWDRRDALLDALHALPLTLCHRDYNPGNLFVAEDGNGTPVVQVIDWDCLGRGVVGEDLADLVCEGLVYYGFDPGQAAELRETAVSAYLSGLRETGWKCDEGSLRAIQAACVALHWSLRVACLARGAAGQAERERLTAILRFTLDIANEAYTLLGT